ncbi:MAG: hypothetical protein ILA34_05875 [Bacteroidaceae bacterium]|nr:hypothetical protein [Bacteroidaceae bacterium]
MMKKLIFLCTLLLACTGRATAGHVLLEGWLKSSALYPGTQHKFWVSVPDAYPGGQPACLFVVLDGVNYRAPEVFDTLMAEGRMPTTIGVYVQPGRIADARGEVLRYNRSNEFDMTDGRFAAFLEQELLPAAQSLRTPDGRSLKFSSRAADRAIMGASSGGIASFNAAWQRPDLFQRVFSAVGTFVPFRGGNDLQAFVRKTEPLPLRIFLQDGTEDTWNPLFGSWYEANRMLESALLFSGYALKCDWGVSGHNGRRAAAILKEVAAWLWEGWPAPVAVGTTQNNLLQPMLLAGEDWTVSHLDVKAVRSPRGKYDAVYPDGTLAVRRHKGSNCLWQYILSDKGKPRYGQRFYWLHNMDNTLLDVGPMAFDAQGNLFVTTAIGIQICDQNGRVRGILRYPAAMQGLPVAFRIMDGQLALADRSGRVYVRRMQVRAAEKGVRPASQGQG